MRDGVRRHGDIAAAALRPAELMVRSAKDATRGAEEACASRFLPVF